MRGPRADGRVGLTTMLGRNWEPAKATIIEARQTLGGMQETPSFKFGVDVEIPGKPSFRTKMRSPFFASHFFPPKRGQVVPVPADAERKKAKFDLQPKTTARQ